MVDLTKKIMRRVYFIWFVRQVFNTITVKIALVFLLAWQFMLHVSVKNVIANWHSDWGIATSYAFLESALTQTEFAVQMLMLGIVAVAALLVRDVILKRRFTDGGRLFMRT